MILWIVLGIVAIGGAATTFLVLKDAGTSSDPGPSSQGVPEPSAAEPSGEVSSPQAIDSGHDIAFVRQEDNGDTDIFTISSETQEETRLTYEGTNSYPTWEPGAGRIAFAKGEGLGNLDEDIQSIGIYVMNADGEEVEELTDGLDIDPAWSPDGSQIAFTRLGEGIFVVDPETSAVDPLVLDSIAFSPTWSPDGNKLAYHSFESGEATIRILTIATGEVESQVEGLQPSWSPEGSRIAFTRFGGEFSDEGEVFVLDLESGNEQPVPTPSQAESPQWSRDGTALVVSTGGFDTRQLFVVPVSGEGSPTRLALGGLYPAWAGSD
jgi:Tol biopolymer transport system component